MNRENNISSTGTWDQEFLQDIGEANELDDPEVASFEDAETAEEGVRRLYDGGSRVPRSYFS